MFLIVFLFFQSWNIQLRFNWHQFSTPSFLSAGLMPYPFVCSVSLLIHNLISWSQIKSFFCSECHTLSCRLLELYALFITHPPLHGVYPYIFENLCSLGALLLLRFLSFYLKAKQTNLSFHFFPLLGLWLHIYWTCFSLFVFILFINFSSCCFCFLPWTDLPL